MVPIEERVLNVKNFLDFICDDFKNSPVYLPINIVSPSEQSEGMTLGEERRFRVFACEIIQDSGISLRLPQVTISTA